MQCFTSKTMHMWHPVAPEEIGGRWEQFHDCFLSETTRKWCPTSRIMSHKKVPQKEAYLGNILILRNPFLSMGSCQKLYVLWLFDTSFACAKWRRPLGGSSWKLLELTSVSRFLAYVTRPHKWRISVALWTKNLCEVKNIIHALSDMTNCRVCHEL